MLSYSHSSPRGPIISGTGCGGLFVIAALFLVLLPAMLAHRPAGSGPAGHIPIYGPVDPPHTTLLHPGLFRNRKEIVLGKNHSTSAAISSVPSGKPAFYRVRSEWTSISTIDTPR